jgi:hypothetical protein
MSIKKIALLVCLVAWGSACISTTVINISQKTSLESQLMGELEPLSKEELLVASVRASDDGSVIALDSLQNRAAAAKRRQLFNRDDLDELRNDGCVGEALGAQLVERPCNSSAVLEVRAEIIEQENVDREVIVDWVLSIDPVLTPADRTQVVALYQQMILNTLSTGHWFQSATGSWSQR